METDPQTVSAYLVYLSQHTPVEEQGQHSDLALVRGTAGLPLGGDAPALASFLGAFSAETLGVGGVDQLLSQGAGGPWRSGRRAMPGALAQSLGEVRAPGTS